jgi:hypothetical protein
MNPQRNVHPLLRPDYAAGWPVASIVRSVAGSLVLAGLALSLLDRWWLLDAKPPRVKRCGASDCPASYPILV